jgi:hypothetical protein
MAESRVGQLGGVEIMVVDGRRDGPQGPGVYTDNVVYTEVLSQN